MVRAPRELVALDTRGGGRDVGFACSIYYRIFLRFSFDLRLDPVFWPLHLRFMFALARSLWHSPLQRIGR